MFLWSQAIVLQLCLTNLHDMCNEMFQELTVVSKTYRRGQTPEHARFDMPGISST